MKNKSLFLYFISLGAIIYTVGSALIFIIASLLDEGSASSILAPTPFLFYLGFAYVISLGSTIMRIEKIPSPIRRVIHASAYIIGSFAFLLLCSMEFSSAVILSALIGVIYAAVFVIRMLITNKGLKLSPAVSKEPRTSSKKNVQKDKKPEYTNRFS